LKEEDMIKINPKAEGLLDDLSPLKEGARKMQLDKLTGNQKGTTQKPSREMQRDHT